MYRRLSSRLARARCEDRFPDLIGTLREVHVLPSWPEAGAFLGEMPQRFRLDRTCGQHCAPYVAAEKDPSAAAAHRLAGREYGIPVLVVRGFGSQSYADLVRRRLAHEDREAVLAYVGDFACSGAGIERDWVQRSGCWARVQRIVLTREQVFAYGLPAAEGKKGDPRWPGFARTHGFAVDRPVQWEAEALDRQNSSGWS